VLKEASNTDYPTVTDIIPTHYLSVHQSAIRTLAWIKVPPAAPSGKPRTDQDPTVITSGGYDGMECMTDIREGRSAAINRTRGMIRIFSNFILLDHLLDQMLSTPWHSRLTLVDRSPWIMRIL